jgi:hypothetical protein
VILKSSSKEHPVAKTSKAAVVATPAPEKVFFWRDSARQIGQWHIAKVDADLNPINETNRAVTPDDIVKYLGFRPDGGQKQFMVHPGQIRVSVPGRSAAFPDQPLIVLDSNIQLNLQADGFTVLATVSGDFAYGLVQVEGFILPEPAPVVEPEPAPAE